MWQGRYLQVRRGLEDGNGARSAHSAELQVEGLLGRPMPRGVMSLCSCPTEPTYSIG